MFTIGEFSRITGLTVKTLRFYHEQGLLAPSAVDEATGYRYYDAAKVEAARAIAFLRGLDLPLAEIAELLRDGGDERLLETLQRQRGVLQERIRRDRRTAKALDRFIASEQSAQSVFALAAVAVVEKDVEPQWIAAVRMRGKYSDCGTAFASIGRGLGRYIAGPCMLLHHDTEFKEDDADFEACAPLRKQASAAGIEVRELPGGRCLSLLHKGPYDRLGPSYAAALLYAKQQGYRLTVPTREVYLRGPGMIFRGNPENYLTEIRMYWGCDESEMAPHR